jgi:adenine-specific DNA-methyltransferase
LQLLRYWRFSRAKMEEMYRAGLVVQTKQGAVPRRKLYLDEAKGVPLQDLWLDVSPVQGLSVEATGYATQKPIKLLERVLSLCSAEGDLVADFFCGSGTTLAVAEKLGRRWIGCDLGRWGIHVTRKRLITFGG